MNKIESEEHTLKKIWEAAERTYLMMAEEKLWKMYFFDYFYEL